MRTLFCLVCDVELVRNGRGVRKYCGRCHVDQCPTGAKLGTGYCIMHGKRLRVHGNPLTVTHPRRDPVCSIEGCDRKHVSQGLCGLHYQRRRSGLPMTVERFHRPANVRLACQVKGCESPSSAKGFCPMHYQRWKNHGDPLIRTRRLPEEALHGGWVKTEKDRFYKFGLTPTEFNRILASQDGRCLGCRTTEPMGKGWVVDHCHTANAVRRILCTNCNTILGLAYEDEDTLLRLAAMAKADRQLKLVL
jgi:hypothetical protein